MAICLAERPAWFAVHLLPVRVLVDKATDALPVVSNAGILIYRTEYTTYLKTAGEKW